MKNIFEKRIKGNYKVPKSVQEAIDVLRIYEDGIFELSNQVYSKCYKFSDINYALASKIDKEAMFLQYSELLNSFDSESKFKITILNRKLNRTDFESNIMIPSNDDYLDEYRNEYNQMLIKKTISNNNITQEKFITVTIEKKNIEEARSHFNRLYSDLNNHFNRLGSKCLELSLYDRIRIAHDIYRIGEENVFYFDFKDLMKKGHSFKDYICPDYFSFKPDYFEMGSKVARVFYLKDYANYIKDDFVSELTDMNKNIIVSIDVTPISREKAVRIGENRALGIETNIANWQRKQNNNNNFSATIPYEMEQQRKEAKDFLDDITTRDQRMFISVMTIMIVANDIKELDTISDSILSIAGKHMCQVGKLVDQQLQGLNTVLPYGCNRLEFDRSLTTESLAVFMPFRVQEINHNNGIYYGNNVISNNIIVVDRKQLQNGNSFILGVSGSGKSFSAKNEIISILLRDPNADVLIIDPEREYGKMVNAYKGQVINISSTSKNHINAMDLNANYGDGSNPVILKSEFVLSLCEAMLGKDYNLDPKEKSIIDRCTSKVYRVYQQGNYQGVPPTLKDLYDELIDQPEKEAHDVATAIERFSQGNFDNFAKQTNVDINNRLVCYDILELGENMQSVAMLIVLDNILNRITSNREKGRNTYIFIDEIYLLFKQEYSANFLFTLWKRVRKYGAFCTGITQNVEDLLQSHTARTMLANSEFMVMLNQAYNDAMELSKLLSMSETQMGYITNVDIGHGLLKVGSVLVPFVNEFPKDTKLYKLMTTKLGEG